jgi:hypothetical protein
MPLALWLCSNERGVVHELLALLLLLQQRQHTACSCLWCVLPGMPAAAAAASNGCT